VNDHAEFNDALRAAFREAKADYTPEGVTMVTTRRSIDDDGGMHRAVTTLDEHGAAVESLYLPNRPEYGRVRFRLISRDLGHADDSTV
jgi:hypothetical protein